MNFNFSNLIPGSFLILIYLISVLAIALVHLLFALGVLKDADELRLRNAGVFFGGPWLWFIATLIGGVLVATAYWIIHHSTLRAKTPPWERTNPEIIE
ncbi:MAG: hypothetical protein SGI98_01025 [Verrucomicrobiota bacterium]|nr:hypothetical protein [Verrucomicrobiota bacterium]